MCGICGKWTPDVRILIKEYLRRSYQVSYDMFLWPESTVMVRMTVTGQQLILPHYIDRVMAVRGGDALQLMPKELTEMSRSPRPNQVGSTPYAASSSLTPRTRRGGPTRARGRCRRPGCT